LSKGINNVLISVQTEAPQHSTCWTRRVSGETISCLFDENGRSQTASVKTFPTCLRNWNMFGTHTKHLGLKQNLWSSSGLQPPSKM